MNKKEFVIISKDRIIHAALALYDGALESPYGARTYGFPTVCRFYDDVLKILDYFTKELLLELPYDMISEVEFSVCSRMSGVKIVPYFIYYGRLIIKKTDSRIYVIEFRLSDILPDICNLLEARQVRVTDRLGIVAATDDYEPERVHKFIEDHIKEWSDQFQISNPQTNDYIVQPRA